MDGERRSLLDRWDITSEELTEVVDLNPSLRGMLFGYTAELKLRQYMDRNASVTSITKDDDYDRKKKGDLRIVYRGREFIIETKSLQTNSIKIEKDPDGAENFSGKAQCDASDRRTVTLPNGSTLNTTCLLVDEFDVLAVNIFGFLGEWRFLFALNKNLPRSKFRNYTDEQRRHLLATLVPVTWPETGIFTTDLFVLLDGLLEQ